MHSDWTCGRIIHKTFNKVGDGMNEKQTCKGCKSKQTLYLEDRCLGDICIRKLPYVRGDDVCSFNDKVEIVVDREELLKALNYDRKQYEKGFADGSARKEGRWLKIYGQPHIMECSVCGSMSIEGDFNYCPKCGAAMVKE